MSIVDLYRAAAAAVAPPLASAFARCLAAAN